MRVGIVGCGAIGGFLAAELSAAGAEVVVLQRPGRSTPKRPLVAVKNDGGVLLASESLRVVDSPSLLGDVEICLVAVKSWATAQVADSLRAALKTEAAVVSFQNGLCNLERLRARLGSRAIGGMVGYNVLIDPMGRRCQTTKGRLVAGRLSGSHQVPLLELQATFARVGERLELRDDVEQLILGKLLLNLNNGICAATGLTIFESLMDRDARFCFAVCLKEGFSWMQAAGLRPARVTLLPPWALVKALSLPGVMVMPVARAFSAMSRDARSSTLQDLLVGRRTEIDDLNGAIARLAQEQGGRAPFNARVMGIVHQHESRVIAGHEPCFISASELKAQLLRAQREAPARLREELWLDRRQL